MKSNGMINRYKTQSISVNEEELQAIKDLALRLRMKPAALARDLFYRGLVDFLDDGLIHAEETDDEIFERLQNSLKSEQMFRVPVFHSATVQEARLQYPHRLPHLMPGENEEEKNGNEEQKHEEE